MTTTEKTCFKCGVTKPLTEQRIAEILAGKRKPHDVEVTDL